MKSASQSVFEYKVAVVNFKFDIVVVLETFRSLPFSTSKGTESTNVQESQFLKSLLPLQTILLNGFYKLFLKLLSSNHSGSSGFRCVKPLFV